MDVHTSAPREGEHRPGQDLAVGGHYEDLSAEAGQPFPCHGVPQCFGLEYRQAERMRGDLHVRLSDAASATGRPVGLGDSTNDLVASFRKRTKRRYRERR
jgi:hypothetical protein